MKTNRTKFLWWLALPALLLSSCIADRIGEGDPRTTPDSETSVRVSLQMPAAAPNTYAISEIDENEVKTIDVLAFKQVTPDAANPSGWAYAYKATGTAITDQSDNNPIKAKKQFTVTLIKSTAQQLFVVLANVKNEVDALGSIAVGADHDALLERLKVENTSSWNANNDNSKPEGDPNRFRPFPMWGEVETTLIDGVTEITGVGMLRSIARLDVVLGSDVITDNNFKLDEIYVYNSKKRGFVVPYPANFSAGKATAATVPAVAADYLFWNNPSPLVYTVPASMNTAFERTMYLFEAQAVAQDKASEATCFVVGGTFGSDANPTYYRLDFFAADNKTYKDVLRNHKYRLNIIKVEGRGFPTPEEAFNSTSVNMKFTVTEWNDGAIGNVVFDGQYALSVAPAEFRIGKDAKDFSTEIFTDVPDGWKATTTDSWISFVGDDFGVKDTKKTLTFNVTQNNDGADRTGYIKITAGRLEYMVKVVQSTRAAIGISIVNASNAPITELVFSSAAGVQPDAQTFTVNWLPVASDLTITTAAIGANAFDGSGMPIAGTQLGGTKSYTVQPSELTTTQLSADPFFTKVSKVDFTTTDGFEYVSKTIFLRQFNYDLIFQNVKAMYMLQGGNFNFTVKSNGNWRIKTVTESPSDGSSSLLNLKATDNLRVGTTGNSNTTTGTVISFRVSNDGTSTLSGTVTVVFESTDNPQKYADKTVVLTLKGEFYPPMHTGWAGSNIYYDAVKGHLTFDDVNVKTNALVNGVVFRWGSLTGMAPAGVTYSTSIKLYPPVGGVSSGLAWNAIPRVSNAAIVSHPPSGTSPSAPPATYSEEDRGYLYEITDVATGLGDICKFLTEKGWAPAGKWRMPTANEFGPFSSYTKVGLATNITITDEAGKQVVSNYYIAKAGIGSPQFPAPSMRVEESGGNAQTAGSSFYYWSGSSERSGTAYHLYLHWSLEILLNNSHRGYGLAVRCVRE